MRVALIHALKHSIPAIEEAFSRLWPEARLANVLDDSELNRVYSNTITITVLPAGSKSPADEPSPTQQ